MGKLTRNSKTKTVEFDIGFEFMTLQEIADWCEMKQMEYGGELRIHENVGWYDDDKTLELQQVTYESDEDLAVRQEKHDKALVKRRETSARKKAEKAGKTEEAELKELERLTEKYGGK